MKEKIELGEQIKRLNGELIQRNTEKASLEEGIIVLVEEQEKNGRKILELERDCKSKLKTANVRKEKN